MSENPWKKWRDAVGPPPVNEQTPSRTEKKASKVLDKSIKKARKTLKRGRQR